MVYATGSNSFIDAPIVDIGISGGEVQYINTINPGTGFSETGTIFTINSYGTYSTGSGFEIMVNGFESGNWNTAIGYSSLYYNTTGKFNTTIGYQSLYNNTQGGTNTSIGVLSLYDNTTGNENTAVGSTTLYSNTTGINNTAVGQQALYNNTTGSNNTSIGALSLYNNKGDENTALGWASLQGNTTGNYNTAVGMGSLGNNQTGSYNIAVGRQAGVYRVSFLGATNSNNSIFIGYNTTSGATTSNATNEIVIGHGAPGNGSNTVTLGNDSVTKTYLKGNIQLPTVPTTSGGSYSILTRNDVTGEVEKIVVTPYKVYTALLTQVGSGVPVAIILDNTLGGVITWSRPVTGSYVGTLVGAFTTNKTSILNNVTGHFSVATYTTSVDLVIISTRDFTGGAVDGAMTNMSIEIRVYN